MKYPLRDHHCHTRYCDGADTVEAMAEAAAARGLAALTFTGHGYTPHDLSCATAPPCVPFWAPWKA